MKLRLKLAVPVLGGALLALAACQQNTTDRSNAAPQSAAPTNQTTHSTADPSLIPADNSHKLRTTNEHGGTSYGMGSSVYSMMGSSGLHSEGFSSHLESRLSGD